MKIKVVLEPSEEGGYTTYVPSLPGCISEGEDVKEALANISEAIELDSSPPRMTWFHRRALWSKRSSCEQGSQLALRPGCASLTTRRLDRRAPTRKSLAAAKKSGR